MSHRIMRVMVILLGNFDPHSARLLRLESVGAKESAWITLERAKAAEKVLPSSWKEARAAMGSEGQPLANSGPTSAKGARRIKCLCITSIMRPR